MATELFHLPKATFEGLPRSVRRFASQGPQNPFFYLPCPVCAEMFGGYEWSRVDGHEDTVPDGRQGGGGIGICMNCTAEGRGCIAQGVPCDGSPHLREVGND